MDREKLDQERAEAFSERMLDILNSGALALMTSIGHRRGLFDAIHDQARPGRCCTPSRA